VTVIESAEGAPEPGTSSVARRDRVEPALTELGATKSMRFAPSVA
jgi:hypothetical protein